MVKGFYFNKTIHRKDLNKYLKTYTTHNKKVQKHKLEIGKKPTKKLHKVTHTLNYTWSKAHYHCDPRT